MKNKFEKIAFLVLLLIVASTYLGYAVNHILAHFWPTLIVPFGAFFVIAGAGAVFAYLFLKLVDYHWKK